MSEVVPMQALKNDIDTMRCHAASFHLDGALIRELLALREFRDSHPIPESQKPEKVKTKSSLVRMLEARLVFGEYLERESARLGQVADLMECGAYSGPAKAALDDDRERNEAIAHRAIAIEAAALNPTPERTNDEQG